MTCSAASFTRSNLQMTMMQRYQYYRHWDRLSTFSFVPTAKTMLWSYSSFLWLSNYEAMCNCWNGLLFFLKILSFLRSKITSDTGSCRLKPCVHSFGDRVSYTNNKKTNLKHVRVTVVNTKTRQNASHNWNCIIHLWWKCSRSFVFCSTTLKWMQHLRKCIFSW